MKNREALLAKRRRYKVAHREEIRIVNKRYRDTHKEKRRASATVYYQEHKEEIKAKARAYAKTHKEEMRKYKRLRNQALKLEVFQHYAGEHPKCAHCGEDDLIVLSVDHLGGGGAKHREDIRITTGGTFYAWLKKSGFPEGFQVLCRNCNYRKYWVESVG